MLPPAPIPDRLTASGFIGMIAMATSLAAPRADAAVALLTVGADAACDFRSDLSASALQDAIDSVPQNIPAGDAWVIHVARNGSYANSVLLLEHRDLTLAGGFSDCSDSVPDANNNTGITGSAMASEPVLTIRGQSRQPTVILRDISISGGHNDDGSGGGIYIDGAVVRLQSSSVTNNSALHGAGVAIRSLYQDAVLELEQGSGIASNTASGDGGGISCYRAWNHPIELRLHSSSAVSGNQAGARGGGIHSDSCSGFINSGGRGLAALVYNVGFNDAQSGGGILVENTRYTSTPITELVLGQGLTAGDPRPVIANNSASGLGGGINVGLASRIRVHSAAFVNNDAGTLGGAVFAGNGGDLLTERQRPRCVDDLPCIAFLDNQAGSGGALAVSHGSSEVEIDGAWFEGNSVTGFGSALLVDSSGTATVENSVATGNSGNTLFQVSRIGQGSGQLALLANTIAANSSSNAVIDIALQGMLSLGRTIIQAGATPVLAHDASNNGYQLTCNLLHEQASVAANIDAASAGLTGRDPGFVDAAGGDFHLTSSGWAVDACAASAFFNGHDHDLTARPVDAPITNLAGPFDVGAFEWTFDLFRDGFED